MSYRKWLVSMSMVAAAAALCGCEDSQRVAKASTPSDSIQRGEYLVRVAGCNDCHTPGYLVTDGKTPVEDWLTGDSLGWNGPWGTTYASNLRLRFQDFRSKEEWVEYARMIRPMPPMPWFNLAAMTDEDLGAIYDFVRHLGPKGNAAPSTVPVDGTPQGPIVRFPM